MDFLIISGLSGAGKSRGAEIFEDIGFYCVDNMPAELIPKFAEMCIATKGRYEHVALVTDIRGGANFENLFEALESLKELGCNYKILFFEASKDTIIHRYKETRRRHPLAEDGMSVERVIEQEHKMLEGVRARADYIIDTTNISTSKLRERLLNMFLENGVMNQSIAINIISFGFKYGVPPESDLVFDVRFLPNPYYITELRRMTGLNESVRDYVMGFQQTKDFLKHLYSMIEFLIPQYIEEGKTSLVISIGCTGGKHRSVALAEQLKKHVSEKGYNCQCLHRDSGRDV